MANATTPPNDNPRINVALPAELHFAVRLVCLRERRTLQDVTAEALRAWVETKHT